jgi:hypothetical protein
MTPNHTFRNIGIYTIYAIYILALITTIKACTNFQQLTIDFAKLGPVL